MDEILRGKRILVVDDEADILATLEEMLDMCLVDTAPDFDTAKVFMDKNEYDAAILDIMGVRGYDLLELANKKGIPSCMLTSHALNADNLVKSIRKGAQCYVSKDQISDIPVYLADMIRDSHHGEKRHKAWFTRLKPYFDRKFGKGWREQHRDFWNEFDESYAISKEELEKMI